MSDFEADFDGAALAEAWRAHRREGLRHLERTRAATICHKNKGVSSRYA